MVSRFQEHCFNISRDSFFFSILQFLEPVHVEAQWGPQVGEVPCLGGVTNLSIQRLFFLNDCFHMRSGVPHLGGLPGQPCQVTHLGGVSFLHVNAEGGVG